MKKTLLTLTLSILSLLGISQTTGVVYDQLAPNRCIGKYVTHDPTKSVRGNMNYICQELCSDSTKVAFYYNSDFDLSLFGLTSVNIDAVYKRIGYSDDAVIRYNSFEEMMRDNTLYQDSSLHSPLNFVPKHMMSDSLNIIRISINSKDASSTNELQTLSISGQSITISSGNTVVVPTQTFTEVDGSITNEIQTLSRTGNTITLTSGGSVTLTPVTDSQTLSISGSSITISNGNTIIIPTPTRTMSTSTRSLNTSYTISTTADYNVNYSVYAQVTSALAGTNTADVYLEISPNNSTWTTISRSGISITGVLSTSGNTQTVGGFIPAGYYVRLRTSATGANSGSAVFTYQNGQENSY